MFATTTENLLKGAVGGGILVSSIMVVMLYCLQNSLIYPANIPEGSRDKVPLPSEFGMNKYDDITLTTRDNLKIKAYVITQGDDAPSRPTVLMLHANAGNMGHRLPLARIFYHTMGCNVMLVSYRGYGLSEGSPDEKGIRIDAQTALDYIVSHPKLEKTKIVLYGQSIGGAVSIALAHDNKQRVDGLVIENTFLSLQQLVPSVMPFVKPFLFLLKDNWDSAKAIKNLGQMPILFLSGRKDTLIPPYHMDQLYKLCSSENKFFKPFHDADHNGTCLKPGYFQEIQDFIRKYVVQGQTLNDEVTPEKVDQNLEPDTEAGSRVPAL